MKISKLLVPAVLVLLLVAGAVWVFRLELILWVTAVAAKENVEPFSEIAWEQGPQTELQSRAEQPPNVIIIYADDLGINDVSAFGGGLPGLTTPNIDRLAREGVSYTEAYAGNATCAPSRAMLLTGRYPTRHGFAFTPAPGSMGRVVSMLNNDPRLGYPPTFWNKEKAATLPPLDLQGLPGSEVTLAEMLKKAGYHTVHIGKWHLGRGPEFHPIRQGFDESLLMVSGLYLPEDSPDVVNLKVDDSVDKFIWAAMQYSASFNDGTHFEPKGYLTDWWTDEAVRVIESNRNRPFFLYFAHWAPHTPYQATRADYDALAYIESEPMRVYAAMVRALDRSVGRVVQALEQNGIAENTIVVFSSDNGGARYIGLPDLNAPYRGWKGTFFEGGIRTPLFMKWPAEITAGTVVERPVSQLDLTPTLVAAVGAALPTDVPIDGIDILDEGAVRPDNALFWQSAYYQAVRQGDWKFQTDPRQGKEWLFDLASDPTERKNLVDAESAKVADMKALLEKHQENAREPLYPYTLEAPGLVDKSSAQRYVPGDEYVYFPN